MADALETALRLRRMGLRVHPCRPRDKIPTVNAWQHRRLTEDDLRDEVRSDNNLGVALGTQNDGSQLVVIDCDGLRWLEWALDRFPAPVLMTRNDPERGGHLWYRWDGPLPRKRVLARDPDEKHSNAQLLSEGAQVVVPPSMHPTSGKRYGWIVDGVEVDDIGDALDRLPVLTAADVLRAAPMERRKPSADAVAAYRALAARGVRGDAVDLRAAHADAGLLARELSGGRYAVVCPWASAHSTDGLSSTAIGSGSDGRWWWRCLHASCEHRTIPELIAAIGFAPRMNNAPPSRRVQRMTRRVGEW